MNIRVRGMEIVVSILHIHHGKKDAESSSTTGSSTGCLQECPGQALSQPGRGVDLSGDKTENQEGVHVGV